MCGCFACMYVGTMLYIPGTFKGRKRELDPLELVV